MDTLTPAEVAAQLGTSPNRVRQLLRERKLLAAHPLYPGLDLS